MRRFSIFSHYSSFYFLDNSEVIDLVCYSLKKVILKGAMDI